MQEEADCKRRRCESDLLTWDRSSTQSDLCSPRTVLFSLFLVCFFRKDYKLGECEWEDWEWDCRERPAKLDTAFGWQQVDLSFFSDQTGAPAFENSFFIETKYPIEMYMLGLSIAKLRNYILASARSQEPPLTFPTSQKYYRANIKTFQSPSPKPLSFTPDRSKLALLLLFRRPNNLVILVRPQLVPLLQPLAPQIRHRPPPFSPRNIKKLVIITDKPKCPRPSACVHSKVSLGAVDRHRVEHEDVPRNHIPARQIIVSFIDVRQIRQFVPFVKLISGVEPPRSVFVPFVRSLDVLDAGGLVDDIERDPEGVDVGAGDGPVGTVLMPWCDFLGFGFFDEELVVLCGMEGA